MMAVCLWGMMTAENNQVIMETERMVCHMAYTLFHYDEVFDMPESDIYISARKANGTQVQFPVGDNIQNGNTLVVGTTRTGKTAFTRKMAKKLRVAYPEAHFVFMDVKQDYINGENGMGGLYQPGDMAVSYYNMQGNYRQFQWSLLDEALRSRDAYAEVRELVELLFEDMGDQGQNQIFVESAKLAFCLFCNVFLFDLAKKGHFGIEAVPSNRDIVLLYNSMSFLEKREWIKKIPSQNLICDEVLPATKEGYASKYAESVMSIIRVFLNGIFCGNFAGTGKDSIRSFLAGEGKALFLEFDYSKQRSSSAFFRLFLKKMIQQKMASGEDKKRKLYLILDESMVVQGDFDLVNALNVGAGTGIRVILACQSTDHIYMQVPSKYIEHQGMAAIAGFANIIAFRPNDRNTLMEIQERFGKGLLERIIIPVDRYQSVGTLAETDYLVSSEQLMHLGVGEAYVKIKGYEPYKIYFCEEEL